MNIHDNQLYLKELHSKSFIMCSAATRINTESKSLIMKFGNGKTTKHNPNKERMYFDDRCVVRSKVQNAKIKQC